MSSLIENDDEQLTLQIEGLSIIENDVGVKIVICAACGKEGEEDSMNICNKCKMVHYCNVACKKKHKSKHKKKCKKRATELQDEALFKDPPLREECPICMLPLPLAFEESSFKYCCGKTICMGCTYAMVIENIKKGKELEEHLCAFCRTPETSSSEEKIRMLEKLVENGNATAYYQFGWVYAQGTSGMRQDWVKANELWIKAGELGYAQAYFNLGSSYYHGNGVEIDEMKGKHFCELAAMAGSAQARHIIGLLEGKAGNRQRAMKHFVVAASAGFRHSLDKVKQGFMDGLVTKNEYESTLRAYHERQSEMKSEARDQATDLEAQRAAQRGNI